MPWVSVLDRDDDPLPPEAFGEPDVLLETVVPVVRDTLRTATLTRVATSSVLTWNDVDAPNYERDNHE